jgi:hypothetical protein
MREVCNRYGVGYDGCRQTAAHVWHWYRVEVWTDGKLICRKIIFAIIILSKCGRKEKTLATKISFTWFEKLN